MCSSCGDRYPPGLPQFRTDIDHGRINTFSEFRDLCMESSLDSPWPRGYLVPSLEREGARLVAGPCAAGRPAAVGQLVFSPPQLLSACGTGQNSRSPLRPC